ncbi:hypothetical protein UB33_00370 [Photobacterium angustum]|uniref:hypothetical protein n=1 Tax=Photobacterium angustum TaxID=661 RepID=UPI0005EA224A|nr:hypothetical protein [Photobacterium angustum]KJG08065.1 hypothetical protein UB33_00370 [Photobacterium angustum]PSV88155.1 hypothetical protein CTN01_20520 [Photobacterium angustum]PSW82296.1 hypothetical protein CTN03_03765 [Photobacterium angustum]
MIRNGIGIIFFIVSGFFVFILGFIAFFDFPVIEINKFIMLGILSIPLFIFHLIGLAFYRGSNWKVSSAITLFIGCTINIMLVISILSVKGSPKLLDVLNISNLDIFRDYISGFAVMAIFMGIGVTLYTSENSAKKRTEDNVDG